MQRMEEGPGASAHQPSRRQALRPRSADPVSIPESERPRRASARAAPPQQGGSPGGPPVDSRIEQGLREIGAALTETIRAAAADVARESQGETQHPGRDPAEPIRALATQIDERLQSIAVRIDKLEDAIRTVASHAAARDGVTKRLDEIAQGLSKLAQHQHRGMIRLAQFQQQGMARLATQHRADLRDFARLTGKGVVAVSRKIRDDLTAAIDRLEQGNGHSVEDTGEVPAIEVPTIEESIRAESEGPPN
jgi:hypothetical protein